MFGDEDGFVLGCNRAWMVKDGTFDRFMLQGFLGTLGSYSLFL